jgi:hypothetical protein
MLRLAQLRAHVASAADAERAIHTLTLAEIEACISQLSPIPKDLPTRHLTGFGSPISPLKKS